MPGMYCVLSQGASLTYSLEVTGDDTNAPGWSAATANWAPFPQMTSLTASATATLGAAATAIRPVVTSYTSGTLTVSLCQVLP